MSHKSGTLEFCSERFVKAICGATRKHYSAEEKIRIVLDIRAANRQERGRLSCPKRPKSREETAWRTPKEASAARISLFRNMAFSCGHGNRRQFGQ
jgi:hypothetical protein